MSDSSFPFLEDLAYVLGFEHDVQLLRVEHLLDALLDKHDKLLDVRALRHLLL